MIKNFPEWLLFNIHYWFEGVTGHPCGFAAAPCFVKPRDPERISACNPYTSILPAPPTSLTTVHPSESSYGLQVCKIGGGRGGHSTYLLSTSEALLAAKCLIISKIGSGGPRLEPEHQHGHS